MKPRAYIQWLSPVLVSLVTIANASASAATFVVTDLADLTSGSCGGSCSLRDAITAANASVAADRIEFALKGVGPFVLEIMTPLPALTDAVTIDGYSQTGAMVNTALLGSNAVVQIELRGGGIVGIGLALCASNTVFQRRPPNGAWKLWFRDGWLGDIGSVASASITLTTGVTAR